MENRTKRPDGPCGRPGTRKTPMDRTAGGTIFNIQNYSVHDGPGIRTIVFFKGCPLRCRWCSNPESQSRLPELAFNATRCLGGEKCGQCRAACPAGAITPGPDRMPVIDRERCDPATCGRPCVAACNSGALKLFGRAVTVDEILEEVEKEGVFYQRSQGGMTLSGGEPLAQPDLLFPLLREASRRYVNTAMETCGLAPYALLRQAAPLLDTLIYDVKHSFPREHERYTGHDNTAILANLRSVAAEFPDLRILVRTPVIPGVNDAPDTLRAICALVAELPGAHRIAYELLPYHRLGAQKYVQLSRNYPMGSARLDKARFAELTAIASSLLGNRLIR